MPKNSYDSIDYTGLQSQVTSFVTELFAACKNACPSETLYGLALCPDEDVQSMFWMANTDEALQQLATKLQKQAAKHGGDQSLDEIKEILRYACTEWKYGEDSLNIPIKFDSDLGLDEIWSTLKSMNLTDSEYDEGFQTVRKHSLGAIAAGIRAFRNQEGVNDDFVTLIQFPDSGDIDELLELATLTNSTKVIEKITAVYQQD